MSDEIHGLFFLLMTKVAKAGDVLDWMKSQPGVTSYRVDLIQERVELWQAYHELLEQKLQSSGR